MKISHLLSFVAIFLLSSASQCPPGQVLSTSNQCICPEPIESCLKYASTTSCSQCSYRYKLSPEGLCYLSQPTEECCVEKKQNGECEKCNAGLILVDGKCEEKIIPACLEMNQEGQCANCAAGYEIKQGKCLKKIKNCVQYKDPSTQAVCEKCQNGYNLMNNICLKSVILGCKKCKNSQCQECFDPFQTVQGHCEIKNCRTYNEYGCVNCQCGFYLTKQANCQEMITGCLRYQMGVCTDCQPHFTKKGSKCVIQGCQKMVDEECQICKDGYVVDKGGCKQVQKKCDYWENGKCKFCDAGYQAVNGKCVELIKTPNFHGGLRRMKS